MQIRYLDHEKYPKTACIQKVFQDSDKVASHSKAVRAFLIADAVASGIKKDWDFVMQIPKLVEELIDGKAWENFYVSKGVRTPYYCSFVKKGDRENFIAFLKASRPNGLGTTVDSLDRLLSLDPVVQKKFRKLCGLKPNLKSIAEYILKSCDQQEVECLVNLLQENLKKRDLDIVLQQTRQIVLGKFNKSNQS